MVQRIADTPESHPVRGAWIEIQQKEREAHTIEVAPREGCVD